MSCGCCQHRRLKTSLAIAAATGADIVTLAADVNESPSISVLQGSHDITAPVTLSAAAEVNVAASSILTLNNALNLGGNTLTMTGAGTVSILGTVTTGAGSVVVNSGVVNGTGTVTGDLTNSGGTVAPGLSPGTLTVTGDYLQTAGSLQIDINGIAGGEFDVLDLTGGTSSLTISDGSLDVVLLSYVPILNDSFDILNFGIGMGTIPDGLVNLDLAVLTSGLEWDISQLSIDGTLTVVTGAVLGDFDGNGSVDLNDYGIMQTNFFSIGQTFNLTGDVASPTGQGIGFGDGIVDIYDFKHFSENLFPGGASGFASALAAASAVPEPSTFVLLLAAVPACLSRRFRRRRIRSVKLSG